MTDVDIIVPVFNTPRHFLQAALDSIRAQSFPRWQAWIVNDGSDASHTAALHEALKSYGDPRLHYVQADHKGPAGSRNVGIAEGHARYVAFLDSDDCWLVHKLGQQVKALDEDTSVSLTHGHYELIDEKGGWVGPASPKVGLNDLDVSQSFVTMLKENFIATSSVLVRRSALEKVGGFDDTFPCLVDKELWLRLLSGENRFHYSSDVVLQYRLHAGNISKKTDLLLATRRRIIDNVERLGNTAALLQGVSWSALKREMTHHMYREAAEAYLEHGRYGLALKYSAPMYAGISHPSCLLFLRSLYRYLARPQ